MAKRYLLLSSENGFEKVKLEFQLPYENPDILAGYVTIAHGEMRTRNPHTGLYRYPHWSSLRLQQVDDGCYQEICLERFCCEQISNMPYTFRVVAMGTPLLEGHCNKDFLVGYLHYYDSHEEILPFDVYFCEKGDQYSLFTAELRELILSEAE